MNGSILWGKWISLVQPCYCKGECGNKPYDLELMLRINSLQHLYNLADEAVASEVMDSRAFSEFCGTDQDSGLVHHVEVTAANVSNVSVTPKLLSDNEENVYGDSGYLGAQKRDDAVIRNKRGKKIRYRINRKPSQIRKLSKSGQYHAQHVERAQSSVRSKVEHVFAVVKRLFGFRKTRYRGRRKQEAELNMLFALANLYLARRCDLTA